MHLSALYIQCRSGFVFLLCFRKYGFSEFKCIFSGSIMPSARNTSVMIPNLSVIREVQFSLRENQPGSNSVHIVGKCSSDALEQNPVQDTLAALLVHSQSCRMKRWVKYNWIWFGLFLVRRFTLSAVLVFFLMCFLKLPFFCVPMQFLGQFMYSDSTSSALCIRSHQWTVQYTVLHCKMNLVETQFTLW